MHTLFQSLTVIPPEWRWLFNTVGAASLALFALGTLSRISLWLSGVDKDSGPLEGKSYLGVLWLIFIRPFSIDCLFARRVFARSKVRGIMLMLITWSFVLLLLGVLSSLANWLAHPAFMARLQPAMALVMDVTGALLLMGLTIGMVKRFFFPTVHQISLPADGVVLVLFWVVVLMGFVLEGLRLAPLGWKQVSAYPIGSAFGWVVAALNVGDPLRAYVWAYVLHGVGGFALIGYLPFSKMFHMLAAQITTFAARQRLSESGGAA